MADNKSNKVKFSPDDVVEYYYTEDAIHIRKIGYALSKKRSNIKNLKNGYYTTKNGDIKKQHRSKRKIDNPVSLSRTFQKLRRVIESEVSRTNDKAILAMTLTYKNDCTDTKQLQHDFDTFLKRFRRYVKTHRNNAKFSYIKIFEPDENPGKNNKPRWHIHLLTFGLYFIDVDDLTQLWGHADHAYITRLDERDPMAVAQYYTGYINVDENSSSKDDLTLKRIAKKKRLKMYPRNFAIYSTSRSIIPIIWHKKKMSDLMKQFPNAFVINYASRTIEQDNKEVNHIDYLNLARYESRFVKNEYKPFKYEEFK